MELVAALPAELVCVADPAARGAAPLLRPTPAPADSAAPGAPFALFLELLATAVPTGQGLPAGGNDLPLAAREPAAEEGQGATALDAALAALPLPMFEPVALPAVAPAAGDAPPAAILAVTADGKTLLPAALPPPVITAGADAASADARTDGNAAAAPLAFVAQPVDDGAATPQPATAALRDAVFAASSARPQPAPPAADPIDLAPPAPADATARSAVPAAEVAAPAVRTLQRDPAAVTPSSAVVSDLSTAPAQWLPSAAPHPSAPAAHSATAATVLPHPQGAVDLRSPTWHEALAQRVQWLVDTQVGEARIKLSPPELGALDVKISLVDDQTFVQLTASSASARDELAHGLPRLRELFSASGLELGGASVHNGREGRPDAGGHAAQAAYTEPSALEQAFADTPSVTAVHRPAGRIDVFA